MLQKVASSAGTVYIEALNGIYAHASAGNDTVVLGNRVELNAGYGAIGSAAKVLSIHARQGFAAQAGLAGSVATPPTFTSRRTWPTPTWCWSSR